MKRLIKLIVALLCFFHANVLMAVVTDGVNYEVVNGFKITNRWIQGRFHTTWWSSMPYCNSFARTAVLHDGYIYITRSNAIMINDTLSQSVIYKLDASNGDLVKELSLTLDGSIYGGTKLTANTVGIDNFGHLYMAPYSSDDDTFQSVYLVDKESGELTLIGQLDKGDLIYRCDYIDVIGDITHEQAECNIMAAGAWSECIYRWHADQGGTWQGGFEGSPYLEVQGIYPDEANDWGYAPVVKMVYEKDGNDYSGNLFYVDGYKSSPILYDVTGAMIENFKDVDPADCPMDVGANGVCEFKLDGRTFLAYVAAQYQGYDEATGQNRACQVYISELGENRSFREMQRYWMVPDALGNMSDGGTRVESINVEYDIDEDGNEEVTLFIFKCYNGMAVYKINKYDLENSFEVDGIYYTKQEGDKAKVIGRMDGQAYEGDIIIPSNVSYQGNNYIVTEIDNYAFAGNKGLSSVELPNTIDRIGNSSFYNCGGLTLILLGGINHIGDDAFTGTNVYDLFLGASVTNIKNLRLHPSVIYSYAVVPPNCDDNSFTNYYGTLHVPAASLAAYFTAEYWCNFANIVADAVEPSLTINKENVELKIGTQLQLTATITPTNAIPNYINWKSTNTNIATVSNDGLITAVETGECDIVASCGYKHAFCHVIVNDTTSSIILDIEEAMLLPNHMLTLTPSASPVMPEGFTVNSSEPAVAAARLVNGKVQVVGIKEGTTTITVGSTDGTATPAFCIVTVYTEPGDVNCDGYINISDVTKLIDYLLSGNPEGLKVDNADTNRDGKVNISDVTTLIDYLLSGHWPDVPVIPTDNHEYVDLGLPSGTLWATMNIGANTPEDYGDYFAWGETEPKDYYDWSTYKWCNGTYNTLTKYCTNSYWDNYGNDGFVDNKTELDHEDDAAYVNWGASWRIPTKEQQDELLNCCTWTWTTRNGIAGQLFIGPNGNTIFLPAAGYRWHESLTNANTYGYYYSRVLNPDYPNFAYGLYFYSDSVNMNLFYSRFYGRTIRAVRISQN